MKRTDQINESKELIANGFLELVGNMSYEAMTISDICSQAKVARMTFYRHFNSKESLVIYILEGYLQTIINEMDELQEPSLTDIFNCRFRMVKYSPLAVVFVNNYELSSLIYDFGKSNSDKFSSLLPIKQDAYTKEFIFGGIRALTARWVAGGMQESPQDMAIKVSDYIAKISR